MGKGPESLGTSGIDAMGREVTFVAGPDYHSIHPIKALDIAADLELEARRVQGSARNAMLERANELFAHAVRSELQTRTFIPTRQ